MKLAVRISCRIIIAILLQTLFDFASLYYSGNTNSSTHYIDVISDEYNLRTQTECYMNHEVASISEVLIYFNWV